MPDDVAREAYRVQAPDLCLHLLSLAPSQDSGHAQHLSGSRTQDAFSHLLLTSNTQDVPTLP